MDNELQSKVLELTRQGISKPLLFVVRVTRRCDMRCVMCDFWKETAPGLPYHILAETIKESKKLGTEEIRLTGGEPTLYPNFFETLELVKELGMKSSFITNGSTLSERMVDRIIEAKPKHIHISVDSSRPEVHNKLRGVKIWNKIINGMSLIKQKNPKQKIVVNYVVSNLNYFQIPELVELFGGELFDEINLIPIRKVEQLYLDENQIKQYNTEIVPKLLEVMENKKVSMRHIDPYIFGFTDSEIKQSLAEEYTTSFYEKHKCIASKYMLFLETNGNLYPCTNSPYKGSKFILGNINKKPVSKIFQDSNYNKKIKNFGDPKICNSCDPISCRLNLLASSIGGIE